MLKRSPLYSVMSKKVSSSLLDPEVNLIVLCNELIVLIVLM